jgi:hypothetical protein
MSKIDFKKEFKHLYGPGSEEFEVVDVPKFNFLMVDGRGDPNTAQAYQDAVEAIYAVAYRIKFGSKRTLDKDYVVPPLEGLWWAEDMDVFTSALDKSAWEWTMMILQPDWINVERFETARAEVSSKKNLAALPRLRLETYHEGMCVQIMHHGSYDDEAPTLHRLHHEYLPANDLEPVGKHHEIYLSDPRKSPTNKLKTVLRQPVRKL